MKKFMAPAKINLFLDVLERREDRFHNIHTVMMAIDLCDEIEMWIESTDRPSGKPVVSEFNVDGPYSAGVPTDERNLVVKALEAYEGVTGTRLPGIGLRLRKNVPHGAGLGGGSSDAAAALVAVRRLMESQIDDEDLADIAEHVGSDCPFFIRGGVAEAAGRGELLIPLPERDCLLLVAWPRLAVGTREAYALLTPAMLGPRSDMVGLRRWLAAEAGDLPVLENTFEQVITRHFPVITRALETMRACGAAVARMSGSGSASFGIFQNDGERFQAFEHLRHENDCFLCRPVAARRVRTDESDSSLPRMAPDD